MHDDSPTTDDLARRAPTPRAWLQAAAALVAVGAVGGALYAAGGRFARHELDVFAKLNDRPKIERTRPADDEQYVLPDASVGVDLKLPTRAGEAVTGIDEKTLTRDAVRLVDSKGQLVAASLNTSGANDALVLVPKQMLRPGEKYCFEVTSKLKDIHGHSFEPRRVTFRVAENVRHDRFDAAFERVPLETGLDFGAFTCVTFGPDGRLWATTIDGRLFAYKVVENGTLGAPQVYDGLVRHAGGPRLLIGMLFDKASTPANPKIWLSHGQLLPPSAGGEIKGADDWTGRVSVLEGPNLEKCRDAIVGLPRSYKDHLNFQPAYGADGAIYFNESSNSSLGAPDAKWGMRDERALGGCVLRLDPALLPPDGSSVDVRTPDGGGSYDPAAPNAPLTVFATGVRSGYDLLLHSNGTLYSGVNGAAAGGNTLARPASHPLGELRPLYNVPHTTDDFLIAVQRNAYYGAPNRTRGEYVVNGGNPTAGADAFEVPQYNVGTLPEPTWRKPVWSFGKNVSPNGMVEYRAPATMGLGHALDGAILIVRYSAGDDIIALFPRADGEIDRVVTGIRGFRGLVDPLDLALDPRTGNVYVAEFAGGKGTLTLLRPVSGESSEVYVQKAG